MAYSPCTAACFNGNEMSKIPDIPRHQHNCVEVT